MRESQVLRQPSVPGQLQVRALFPFPLLEIIPLDAVAAPERLHHRLHLAPALAPAWRMRKFDEPRRRLIYLATVTKPPRLRPARQPIHIHIFYLNHFPQANTPVCPAPSAVPAASDRLHNGRTRGGCAHKMAFYSKRSRAPHMPRVEIGRCSAMFASLLLQIVNVDCRRLAHEGWIFALRRIFNRHEA